MRARILEFVQTLRNRGLDVSVAETLDAVAAVAAAGVEREVLRESLAAALVKDERDRAAFDALFDAMFPLVGPAGDTSRRKRRRAAGGGRRDERGTGEGEGRGRRREAERTERSAMRPPQRTGEPGERGRASRAARTARLLALPFVEFTSCDVDEARDLVRELGRRLRARLARRERAARRGRVDFRRTIRGSIATGGVPVRPRWRARRPARPDLVALCDLSGSVAAASELCLGLLAPAADYFRRVHFFAYVDRLVPVSIEDGHVAPEGRLDLHARSDFGRVLADLSEQRHVLGRSTLLLVVGDARNNRRPPRADLFRAVAERAQRVLWLVPEPGARWNTGDSALAAYAPACDAVVECVDLQALVCAVRRAL
jgi:uncharacterized protein with von Willebrand factor type A (vWA) domain